MLIVQKEISLRLLAVITGLLSAADTHADVTVL